MPPAAAPPDKVTMTVRLRSSGSVGQIRKAGEKARTTTAALLHGRKVKGVKNVLKLHRFHRQHLSKLAKFKTYPHLHLHERS